MFGLNSYNLNMNSMMSFMPFMNSGCGSYGTSFLNAGSLFGFNCSGYNTPVGCGYNTGCGTNWKSILGLSVASAVTPALGALVTTGISALVNNSNKNQQKTVSNDITTLKSQAKTLKEQYDAKNKEVEELTTTINTKKVTLDDYPSKIQAQQDIIDEYRNNDAYITILGCYSSLSEVPDNEKDIYQAAVLAKSKADTAKTEKEKLEREQAELDEELNNKETGLNAKLAKANEELQDIKNKLDAKQEQIKNAQAELDELILDNADGAKSNRTSQKNFNDKLDIKAEAGENGKTNYLKVGTNITDITKRDIRYIINQYSTSTPENKEKWADMLKTLWADDRFDQDIRNNPDIRKAYNIICEK